MQWLVIAETVIRAVAPEQATSTGSYRKRALKMSSIGAHGELHPTRDRKLCEEASKMPTMMRQARVYGVDDLRMDVMPVPVAAPTDVVVRVTACGICGSDIGYIAKGGLLGPTDSSLALGHEAAGIVAAVGDRVNGLRPGMHVAINPDQNMIGSGGPEGALAPFLLVRNAQRDRDLYVVPDNLGAEYAALAEPLSVALRAVNQAQAGPGSKVVVLGAGPIGLGIVIGLRRRGVTDIVAVDLIASRLEVARRLGARVTVDASKQNLREVLATAHGSGERIGWPVVNTDVFLDTAGSATALDEVIQMCRLHARIVVVAVYKYKAPIDLVQVMAKEIVLTGAIGLYRHNEFSEAIRILTDGENDLTPLVSHRIGFDSFADALTVARDTERSAKVSVLFPEGAGLVD
jgi:threonine dehydrogenase-like Zn-dependent dehydrogenase